MEASANQPTQDRVRDVAHGLIDKAIDKAAPATEWLEGKTKAVTDGRDQLAEYVNANPVKALAIAFVAGIIVGRITG